MSLNNVLGRPVLDEDFFNRVLEQERLWRRLENDNVLLLAPRRVGKTSLLRRMQSRAETGTEAVYVSVSDRSTELEFIGRLYEEVAKRAGGGEAIGAAFSRARDRLPRLRKIEFGKIFTAEFSEQAAQDWQTLGATLVGVLRESERRWLFLVDELPLFVLTLLRASRERARTFLNWFRECRTDTRAGSTRWLLAGSIGLDTVAARERLGDTINDLAIEPLGPFSPEDADRFLVALAESYGMQLSTAVRACIVARVGWLIPFHLQLVFSTLVDRSVKSPTVDDVNKGYGELLRPAHKAQFDWWVQRLEDELGRPDAGHARAVLASVARDDRGAPRSVLGELLADRGVVEEADRRFILDALETDGYLVAADGHHVFRSPLLRDYWRERVLA